jgi:probable phosphoglycerate mutase
MGILYLTRHGETEWNKEWRLQGKKNSALTPKGVWQAKQLGRHLEDVAIDKIYTSSSPRAVHTANCIRGKRDIPIVALDALMEIGLGSWEGQTAEDLRRIYPVAFEAFWSYPERYIPVSPEGETFEVVQRRMRETIDHIQTSHPNEAILVVTHGISLKLLLASLENKELSTVFKDDMIHSASLTRVDYGNGRYEIAYKNWIDYQVQWDQTAVECR